MKRASSINAEREILKMLIGRKNTLDNWDRILKCKLNIIYQPFNDYYVYYGNKESNICLLFHEEEYPDMPNLYELISVLKFPETKIIPSNLLKALQEKFGHKYEITHINHEIKYKK